VHDDENVHHWLDCHGLHACMWDPHACWSWIDDIVLPTVAACHHPLPPMHCALLLCSVACRLVPKPCIELVTQLDAQGFQCLSLLNLWKVEFHVALASG
jgi:hypothetical protein